MDARSAPSPLAFPRARRLTRPAEFARVKAEGQAQRGTLLVLGVLQIGNELPFRAGFVTPRRVGVAVVRNRVRRRLREIVRKNQHAVRVGCWLVTIARPAAAKANYDTLEAEWMRLAAGARIMTKQP